MQEAASREKQNLDTKASNLAYRLWLIAVFLLVVIATMLSTAWSVNQAIAESPRLSKTQSRIIIGVAQLPGHFRASVQELLNRIGSDPQPLLIERKTIEKPYWVRSFPAPEDSGYLLFSGVDPTAKQSVVQLIRISDGAIIARWNPNWSEIYEQHSTKKYGPIGSPIAAQAGHPLLLASGDVVFNTGTSLVRISSCSSQPVWVLDEVMHHSNELDLDGTIWVPSVSQDGFPGNPWLREQVRDDALAHITADGKVLEKISFSNILINNGLQTLLLGSFGERLNSDPIHLNEIQIASQNGKYWKQGDLLISARHLSTIFLYRPSTGKILWHKAGPWLNQHSAEFVDDHTISVFDNNVISGTPKENSFIESKHSNRVILYNFDTNEISEPFATMLTIARPITITGGRARVLPDGGLFLEETENGRHLRFSKNRLIWSRINDYDVKRIGIVSWSRYLTAEEVRKPIAALRAKECNNPTVALKIY